MASADQGGVSVLRTPWSKQFATPVRAFLQTASGSAGILAGAIVVAIVWANLGSSYESVWTTPFGIRLGDDSVTRDLRTWVNSGLMTVFFLVLGLEARREIDLGDLRDRWVAVHGASRLSCRWCRRRWWSPACPADGTRSSSP